MRSESPRRLRAVNALAAHGKYDHSPGKATLGLPPDRPLAGRLERRGSLAGIGVIFSPDRWESWAVALVLFALAGGFGAWIGEREARRAILAGQSPTLAQLRARVARLRSWVRRFDANPEALDELTGIDRELLDLTLSAPRRSIDPNRPHLRSLGASFESGYRPGRPVPDSNLKIEPPDEPRGAQ